MKKRITPLIFMGLAMVMWSLPATAAPSSSGEIIDDGVIDSPGEGHHGGDDHQHGGEHGHLPESIENVSLVGELRVTNTPDGVADVAVHNGFAYVNAWREECPKAGTHVIDVRDPADPKKVAFIPSNWNSYPGEGAHAIHVDTQFFNGDVLLVNNEACDDAMPFDGGISLFDITNPKKPRPLSRGVGDWDRVDPRVQHPAPRASQSHSVFGWDAGARAYAVFVDNEELADVDILDITQPWAPVHVGEFDLNAMFPQIVQPDLGTVESFHHDVVVKNIDGHWMMLVSYWDGGYTILNVDDPTHPTYVADNDFANPDPEAAESGLSVTPEGNAHEAEFTKDNDYIVAADEDFNAFKVTPRIPDEGKTFQATQGDDVPQVNADNPLSGDAVFVGLACPGDTVPAAPSTPSGSQIAVVERGVCFFTEKLTTVEAAGGYEGIIVFNRQLPDGCDLLLNMDIDGNTPSLFVQRSTGWDFFDIGGYDDAACRAGTQPTPASLTLGTVGDFIDVSAIFDGWGYVHLFRNGTGKLQELDTYAIPEAHDPAFAEGFGDLTVHEAATSPTRNDLVYFSYYSAGLRVVRIVGDELVETGHYVDHEGNNFWGVQVFHSAGKEYVAASDMDHGLFIFEYTGPGSPNA